MNFIGQFALHVESLGRNSIGIHILVSLLTIIWNKLNCEGLEIGCLAKCIIGIFYVPMIGEYLISIEQGYYCIINMSLLSGG